MLTLVGGLNGSCGLNGNCVLKGNSIFNGKRFEGERVSSDFL